jgi:hypothetical protein
MILRNLLAKFNSETLHPNDTHELYHHTFEVLIFLEIVFIRKYGVGSDNFE